MAMQYQQGDYTVVAAVPFESGRVGVAADVPEDIRARFYGRRFTRQQLEELGVEFRGDMALARDEGGTLWTLKLTPEL